MTTFNIARQDAATINNVGGDMVVGAFHAGDWKPDEVRTGIARLEHELARLGLPRAQEEAVRRALAEARGGDDPRLVAPRLGKVARILREAGALSKTSLGVLETLSRTAVALGPAGKTVLAVLAAVV